MAARLDGPGAGRPARHGAADVGDEPLLLAAFAPVWVARDRAAGARAPRRRAARRRSSWTTGSRTPAWPRTCPSSWSMPRTGFGNGRVIPAGPLREPVAAGLARADLLLSIGDAAAQARFALLGRCRRCRAAACRRAGAAADGDGLGRACAALAFAGIGQPEKFFATLRDLGRRAGRDARRWTITSR